MGNHGDGSLLSWTIAGFTALGAVLTGALKWEGLRSKVGSHDHRLEAHDEIIETIRSDISEIKVSVGKLAARGE